MAEISLGKLQCQNDKLLKDNLKLRDNIDALKKENLQLKKQLNKLKNEMVDKIQKAVEKAVANAVNEVKKNYENIIKEKDDRIFKLEQRLNISSDTSSLPPSKDPLWKKDTRVYDTSSTKTSTKTKGGQIGHKKNILEPFGDSEVTEVVEHSLQKCPNCENTNLEFIGYEYHDELDFKVEIIKRRHRFGKYKCKVCSKLIVAPVPKRLWGKNQYGPNVQSLGLTLLDFGDVSYKRTRDIIRGLTHEELDPCEGYLAKLPKKASKMLSDFIFDAEEEIVKSEIVQHDDGVIKIGKTDQDKESELKELIDKREEELTDDEIKKLNIEINKNFKGVLRAYTNGKIKLYKAHTSKSGETFKEDNILTRLTDKTTVVHDHMTFNYNEIFQFENAECNIHPIRKGRGVKANTNHAWPDKIADLLEGYNAKKKENIKNKKFAFSKEELDDLSICYDNIICAGIIECSSFKHKNIYSDESNLLDFFKKYKKEILAWAYNYKIPFSNNLCESMIRLVKSKMKISYSFKSIETARDYANIISYTETCYSFGIDRYTSMKRLFDDKPFTIAELKKLETNETF